MFSATSGKVMRKFLYLTSTISIVCLCGCSSSTDPDPRPIGDDWTMRTSTVLDGVDDITWAGSQFVAVNTGTELPAVSPDGLTWLQAAGGFQAQDVQYYNGHIVAGEYEDIYHSTDGINWDTIQIDYQDARLFVRTFQWGLFVDETGFVAWADSGVQDNKFQVRSTDGINWTVGPEPYPFWLRQAMASTTDHTVELGVSGEIRHNGATVDGVSGLTDVIYDGSQFVAVGSLGSATSADGTIWAQHGGPGLSQVVHTGSVYVALGAPEGDSAIVKNIYTSPDAVTWTLSYRELEYWWGLGDVICFGSNRVLISRSDGLLTSP